MTPRLLPRFARALFALWFVAMVGDTGALHACAMHGGAGHGHAAGHSVAMPGHSSHQAAGGERHSGVTTDDASQHERTPACTCLGECCAAAVAVPVPGAPEVNVATVVAVPDQPLDLVARVAPATAGLRLPFANGPPAA